MHRAASWLVDAQDSDGRGADSRHRSPNRAPNPYNTRTAFSLVRAFQVCRDDRFLRAAVANAEWAARQARPNGWNTGNCLTPQSDDRGLTHTIAYAMRGLLEVGHAAGRADLVDLAVIIGRAVAAAQRDDGSIPGYLGPNWQPKGAWSCLTGNSQMAINWQRVAALTIQSVPGECTGGEPIQEPVDAGPLDSGSKRSWRHQGFAPDRWALHDWQVSKLGHQVLHGCPNV